MLKADDPKLFEPPSTTARMFVRRMRWFSVGVGVGLSPYLGALNIPLFKPLLNSMPFQVRFELIALSSFLLGIVAVAVEFYAMERVPPRWLAVGFGLGLILLLVGFFRFVDLRDQYTVNGPAGNSEVTVLIGASHRKTCPCEDPEDDPVACVRQLGLDEAALARCWGAKETNKRGRSLGIAYLGLTGGFGGLVGALVLQDVERRRKAMAQQAKKKSRPKLRKRRKAADPAVASEAQPPEGRPSPAGPPVRRRRPRAVP